MYDLIDTFTLVSLWINSTSTVSYNSKRSKDNNNMTYYWPVPKIIKLLV